MNPCRAFEAGLVKVIRQYGEIGPGVRLSSFQNEAADAPVPKDETRKFPIVAIRCTPPRADSDVSATLACDVVLLCATLLDDDMSRARLSSLYEGVQDVIDKLYFQGRASAGGEHLTAFKAAVAAEASGVDVWGVTLGEPVAPYDDDGVSTIGIGIRIHFTRNDI